MKRGKTLLALVLLFFGLLFFTEDIETSVVAFVFLVVIGAGVYVLVRYILPWLWEHVLKPVGRATWFILLLLLAALFYALVDLAYALRVPIEIQILVIVASALYGGYKWARSKTSDSGI